MDYPKINQHFKLTEDVPRGNILNPVFSAEEIKQQNKDDIKQLILQIRSQYPRIANMIDIQWGTLELHKRLSEMTHIDTDNRQGFPVDIGLALLKIQIHHMNTYNFQPVVNSQNRNAW